MCASCVRDAFIVDGTVQEDVWKEGLLVSEASGFREGLQLVKETNTKSHRA